MRVNGRKMFVESLVARGAAQAFRVPGKSYPSVLVALHDTAGNLDYVLCRSSFATGSRQARADTEPQSLWHVTDDKLKQPRHS